MNARSASARFRRLAFALAVAGWIVPAQALELVPLAQSPYIAGSLHNVLEISPSGDRMYGVLNSGPAGGGWMSFYWIGPDGSPSYWWSGVGGGEFWSTFTFVQNLIAFTPSPDGAYLFAATATGLSAYVLGDRTLPITEQGTASSAIGAVPTKGVVSLALPAGTFVYVNENVAPANRLAVYRHAGDGGLVHVTTIATGAPGSGIATALSGRRLASVGRRLFVLHDGSVRATPPRPSAVAVFDVADDGMPVAVAGSPFTLPVLSQSMAVAPDGKAVYLGTLAQSDKPLRVVRFGVSDAGALETTGREYEILPPGGTNVNSLAVHTSGRWIAATEARSATSPPNDRVVLLDTESGEVTEHHLGTTKSFNGDAQFDRSGAYLYVSSSGAIDTDEVPAIYAYRLRWSSPPVTSCVGTADSPVILTTDAGVCGTVGRSGTVGLCAGAPGEEVACTANGVAEPALPPGYSQVTVQATSAGGTASCVSHVHVVDREPPKISLQPAPAVLWPPDRRMVPVDLGLHASDNCDPLPIVRCSVGIDDSGLASVDGSDVVWTASGVELRATRSGASAERRYSVSCEAQDASANVSPATEAMVIVPHDMRSPR